MAARKTGRRPHFDEQTHAVRLQLTPAISRELGERAPDFGLSKKMMATFCVLNGLDQIAGRLGLEPMAMPSVFRPAQEMLTFETLSRRAPRLLDPQAPEGVVCYIPESLYERGMGMAQRYGVSITPLCSWAAASYFNALLTVGGQLPLSLPENLQKFTRLLSGAPGAAQPELVAAGQEAYLAS